MALYRDGNFEEAGALFQAVLDHTPEDKAAQLYVQRCDNFKQRGVPDDWEGITTFE